MTVISRTPIESGAMYLVIHEGANGLPPKAGTGDWRWATRNAAAALKAYNLIEVGNRPDEHKSVIVINPSGEWHTVVEESA